MTGKINKIIPVGLSVKKELIIGMIALVFSVCRSLSYFYSYYNFYNSMFEFIGDKKVLLPGRDMMDFHVVTENCFDGFLISAFIFLVAIIFHYGYHHKDSKSIYTMKRLPQKCELHIRCITLPAIGIALCIILSFLLLLLFYYHYVTVTPPECLLPDQWRNFWINLIYGGNTL